MRTPKAISKLVDILAALPGVGPRQAVRLAFHMIRLGKGAQKELEEALHSLQEVAICKRCFYIHEDGGEFCEICSDKGRDHSIIAIVEKETDLISLENTNHFKGRYLVLGELGRGGVLGPDQKLKLKSLASWIKDELGGKAQEIIVALNPNPQGDFIATQISREIESLTEKVTRLGMGIPSGGEIEFADEDTLGSALERRR